jgi:hypothetical protein
MQADSTADKPNQMRETQTAPLYASNGKELGF